MFKCKLSCFCLIAMFLAAWSVPALAAEARKVDLPFLLENLVKNHDRILSSEARLGSARHRLEGARGGWYPHVDATGQAGHEEITRPQDNTESMLRNEQTLTARQLIYDFGKTQGTVDAARGQVGVQEVQVSRTRQEVLTLGITAYLHVIRAREQLMYARRSEESIRQLSGMQEALVKRGAGYSYEELQVKGQLAGAQSYRVTQERGLEMALNKFRAVFGFVPTQEEIGRMRAVAVPGKKLPVSLDEALDLAFANNPNLLEVQYDLESLQGKLKSREGAFFPRVDAVLEGERKENDQSDGGVRTESRAMVEMSYNLFSGFSDSEEALAIRQDIVGRKKTMLDRRRTVEEGVRNAWLELTTLRQNSELYDNQAGIVWEFLRLIKKKRVLGEEVRLLDILVGERDYINAVSAKVAADIDIVIAGYRLLYEMGLITDDVTQG